MHANKWVRIAGLVLHFLLAGVMLLAGALKLLLPDPPRQPAFLKALCRPGRAA